MDCDAGGTPWPRRVSRRRYPTLTVRLTTFRLQQLVARSDRGLACLYGRRWLYL